MGLETDGLGPVYRFVFVLVVEFREIVDGVVVGIALPEGTLIGAEDTIGVGGAVPPDGDVELVAPGLAIGAAGTGDGIPDDGTVVTGEALGLGIGAGDPVGLVIGIGECE
ncbi:MAG: hypothetical protein H0X31_10895 [Nostocaceae cyanobacterium]|nr:hypothetical protein [Nostocaceae cyanobacterium]